MTDDPNAFGRKGDRSMLSTRLTEGWKIIDTAPGAGNASGFSRLGMDTSAWLNVPVPGDVNAVLVAAGKMPDPFFGDNARECYWVTGRDWWYRLEFPEPGISPKDCLDLCLDGIDGHADVYLNGEQIAHFENAFRLYRIDIAGKLKMGRSNVLLIRFHSIDSIMGGPRRHELEGWGGRRALMRKPQFSFGWDWSLPLPSIGITGGAWIERHQGFRLLDASVQTFISGRLDFAFVVSAAARDAGYRLRLGIQGNGYHHEQVVVRPGRVNSYTTAYVHEPKLWWPRGMGEAALYDYEVSLEIGAEVVDRRAGKLGIRETRIVEEPFTREAGPGFSFWLEINGQRVFCKGANWVPLAFWPGTAGDEQYHFYVQKAVEAGFNMLRVWGGGIYERELFYDLCDASGIMVWQDFMFAGTAYPLDRLRSEIIAEADYQIKRLRNRACVTIWCGCNEDVFSWSLPNEKAMASADAGVSSKADPDSERQRLHDDPQLYSMILRGLVGRHGQGVPYVESSPQSRDDAGNMPESGNSHISCWKFGLFETGSPLSPSNLPAWDRCKMGSMHPEKFREHFQKVCSFDSEFCIQGPCDVRSLQRFLPPEHHWPPDDLWTYHIQRGHEEAPHHEQTIVFAESLFGPVNGLQEYVKYGQAVHAEMMRAEFESARRDRPNNGGTMMWMFNDCWPTSNWSIIDYYRHPKPSYYAAKRACATWLPIIFERNEQIEWFFSNDGRSPCRAEIMFGQASLDGSVLWEDSTQVHTGACDTVRFHSMSRTELMFDPGDHLFIDAVISGRQLPRVTYFPDLWRGIPWPYPEIEIEVVMQESAGACWVTSIDVTSNVYARFFHVLLPDDAQPSWVDDNFFDITAGHTRRVSIQSARAFTAQEITTGHWHTEWP
jgi:beta-mannosidase